MKINLRVKLTLSFILVVLLTGILSIIIGFNLILDKIVAQARSTVLSHINTSELIYEDDVNILNLQINRISVSEEFIEAFLSEDRLKLQSLISLRRQEVSLDILNVTNSNGRILARGRNPEIYGDSVIGEKYVKRTLQEKKAFSGSGVFLQTYLQKEGPDLGEKAIIRIVDTPRSRKEDRLIEDRGLMQVAASPIIHKGKVIGVIYGANLINNDFAFVDRMQLLVYENEDYSSTDAGNATIFLDDVRVSTNVRNRNKNRALGTLVSEEVYNAVIKKGETWLGRAFVVNQWYISAYRPIRGIDNDVIGMFYVGIQEKLFQDINRRTIGFYILMILAGSTLAVILSLYFIKAILTPYKTLIESSKQLARGSYIKVDIDSQDEVGDLARAYNKMIAAIRERDEKLREQTEQQLGQSEKLASLGRMASGIAHEINNPLTGILTYSSMLLEDFRDTEFEEDLQTIVDETMRCRKIVKGVLDFARETKLEKEWANVNDALRQALSLLERHYNFHNIEIIMNLDKNLPENMLDLNLMRSVFNNLAVNAADAMPKGGRIIVSTRFSPKNQLIIIDFTDTGIGIPPENLSKIFDPFFTTKEPGKGTGLGMAVTYGIIKRHNGTIDITSKSGIGTTVTIELPLETEINFPEIS
jgi:two-component system, NtrC family, sensor kinase